MTKTEVIAYFKGVKKTADKLGITHPTVSEWAEIIPEAWSLKIERMTKGKLKHDEAQYEGSPSPYKAQKTTRQLRAEKKRAAA